MKIILLIAILGTGIMGFLQSASNLPVVADNSSDRASIGRAVPVTPGTFNLQWNPGSTIAENQVANGIAVNVNADMDWQSGTLGQLHGLSVNALFRGNSTPLGNIEAGILKAQSYGSAGGGGVGILSALMASSENNGTGVWNDVPVVVSSVVESAPGAMYDPENYNAQFHFTNGAKIGNYQGFNFDTQDSTNRPKSLTNLAAFNADNINVTGFSTAVACAFCARTVTGAAKNYGIHITGTEPNYVAGPMQAASYQETLYTPASSSAPCTQGQFADDANYHYVCVRNNVWKRAALSSF